MAIRVASSLHRNRYGILYFRMAVPADLRHRFQCKEIYRSLRTASITGATETAQTLSIILKQAFTELRQQSMSDDQDTSKRPPISLDDVLKHAREKLYLRSRIDELEQARETSSMCVGATSNCTKKRWRWSSASPRRSQKALPPVLRTHRELQARSASCWQMDPKDPGRKHSDIQAMYRDCGRRSDQRHLRRPGTDLR